MEGANDLMFIIRQRRPVLGRIALFSKRLYSLRSPSPLTSGAVCGKSGETKSSLAYVFMDRKVAVQKTMARDDDLIPTRQTLLSRLKDWNDGDSWQEFFDTYWKLILQTALRAGLNQTEAEEVVQETLITVSKAIREFRYDPGRGSFKGWLRTTTVWRIRDRLRRSQKEQMTAQAVLLSAETAAGPLFADDDIESDWDSGWEDSLEHMAVARVKKRVPPKQFQIFDLAVVKQWPTERIAETFRVRSGYVHLVKYRISCQVRSEIRKLRTGSFRPRT